MKRYNIQTQVLLIAGCLLPVVSSAQATFQEKIHILNADWVTDMKQTLDSGYIITGEVYKNSDPYYTGLCLVKTDKSGAVTWNKTYNIGDDRIAIGWEVQQTADEGYIAAGSTRLVNKNAQLVDQGVYVIKTDAAGTLQWSKEIRGNNFSQKDDFDIVYSIQQTSDKGYILAGSTTSYGSLGANYYNYATSDIYLIKLGASGDVVWTKTFGNKNVNEVGYCVRETSDGGYVVAGTMDKTLVNHHYACLLKTDASGTLQWTQSFAIDTVNHHIFKSVEETTDKGFIIAGSYTAGNYADNAWLVKTDNMGNLGWNKAYFNNGYTDIGLQAQQIAGGYILGGETATQLAGSISPMLIMTDDSGNVSWAKKYGEEFPGSFASSMPVMGGGYALLRYSYATITPENNYGRDAYTSGNYIDMFLVKTDANGNTGGCQGTLIPTVTSPVFLVSSDLPASGKGATTAVDPGTKDSSFSVQDSVGCFTDPITANFNYFNNTTCFEDDSVIFSNFSNGILFQWDFGDPASGTNNRSTLINPRHLYTATGTYTVTLIAADGDGSPADTLVKSLVYSLVPKDFLSAGGNTTVCSGDTATITAGGGLPGYYYYVSLDYPYSPYPYPYYNAPFTVGDTLKKAPVATTTYTIVGQNGACTDTALVTVTVINSQNVSITGQNTLCSGDSTVLNAAGGGSYLWSTGENDSSVTVSPPSTSAYWVAVTNGACSDTAKTTVTVLANPVISGGEDITIQSGGSVLLSLTSGSIYRWEPQEGLSCTDCPSPTATPTATTTYYAKVTDINGCTGTDSVTVFVEVPCGDVFVPTAFSPNNDGYNDVLYANVRCAKNMEFKIYDRWGNMVFQSVGATAGWDGTYKKKPLNSGVFVYYLQGTLSNGVVVNQKGNISLVR